MDAARLWVDLRWGFVFIVTLIDQDDALLEGFTVTFAVGIALFLLGCLCGFLAGLLNWRGSVSNSD